MTNFDTTTIAAALITAIQNADVLKLQTILEAHGVQCFLPGGLDVVGYGVIYLDHNLDYAREYDLDLEKGYHEVDADEYRGASGGISTDKLVADLIEVIEMVQAVA